MRRLLARFLSSSSSPPSKLLQAVRTMPDFAMIWECERRLEPFGRAPWSRVTPDKIRSWSALFAGSRVKKHEVLHRIASDLSDADGSAAGGGRKSVDTMTLAPPLGPREAYSFTASVDREGIFVPDPPVASLPSRMYRVYGPHRFLRVRYAETFPRHARLGVLHFAGRRWELLYADLGKRTLVYFAVKGEAALRECSVGLVREWHIPISSVEGAANTQATSNASMTLAKYNARFSLAFSESIATVPFDWPMEVIPDVVSPSGHVMTDGCAAMPLWAMQQIATAAQLPVLPSVVQGRVGSAKGVWYLDPFATNPSVRPSQIKWQLPFPTLEQRRFELCEWSRDRGPASLNYQFIQVLLHLGVPLETFNSILREHAGRLRSDLVLRPRRTSQALPMLAAGFVPESSPYLRKLLSHSAGASVGRLGERMRVPVDRSRWLMVVADPSGCLRFGQAFVHPSSMLSPVKGRVIAARNPCHLPSDVQVLDCVAEPRLAHIRDALVLPVHGPYPPAQLLSGGDYDGDLVFVSWDPRLLPPAGCPERMPPPALPVSPFVPSGEGANPTIATGAVKDVAKDISGAILELFRGFTPVLGMLTQIHAAIVEKEGVASEPARRAAWLCREAVDSPKSGARVRIPKSLAAYGMLSREHVLSKIREEANSIRASFIADNTTSKDTDDVGGELDSDLVIPGHTKWLSFARAEWAEWRRAVHSAMELGGSDMDTVKGSFRRRFLDCVASKGADRLELASAYYVCCATSTSQSFAFGTCFRELIRLKADAQELRDVGDIALCTISRLSHVASEAQEGDGSD